MKFTFTTKVIICIFVFCTILLIRYYILLQYLPVKKIPPIKDGSLCPDIFDLYENNIPSLSFNSQLYTPLKSSIIEKTLYGDAILSIKNDGVLEYRFNGILIWSSENSESLFVNHEIYKLLNLNDYDVFEKKITFIETGTEEFSLTLVPFAIHKRNLQTFKSETEITSTFKTVWDLNGWESNFRPLHEKPYGTIFLMSENRHIQVALLSNGDLVAVEKTSLSKPHVLKTSLLQSYCT
jgi:hypothetical protein